LIHWQSKILWTLLIYKPCTINKSYCECLLLLNSMICIYTTPLIPCVPSPLVSLWKLWSQPLAARPVDKRWPSITAGCCRIVPWQTPKNIQYIYIYIYILSLPNFDIKTEYSVHSPCSTSTKCFFFLLQLHCVQNVHIFYSTGMFLHHRKVEMPMMYKKQITK
jgi:hypothetical protein